MIFWILLGLTIAAMVGVFLWSAFGNYGDGILAGLGWAAGVAFIGAIVGFVVILCCVYGGWSTGTSHETDRYNEELRALAAGDGIEGQFYLGYGRVDGENVFNYIVQRDGYSTLERSDADVSKVYEDESASPYVTVIHYDWTIWWAVPWVVTDYNNYDFHVPEGSVSGGYEVTP